MNAEQYAIKTKAMIERRLAEYGYANEVEWGEDEDNDDGRVLATINGRFRLLEDTDMHNADDEGVVTLSVVGAPEYGNESVYIGFLGDDTDCPSRVSFDQVEQV